MRDHSDQECLTNHWKGNLREGTGDDTKMDGRSREFRDGELIWNFKDRKDTRAIDTCGRRGMLGVFP